MATDGMLIARPGEDGRDDQPLKEHLHSVADLAQSFLSPHGLGELAYWAGLWHDLGKANPEWQRYLERSRRGKSAQKVPHALWGAALVRHLLGGRPPWEEVALPIAAHHTGLRDPSSIKLRAKELIESHREVAERIHAFAHALGPPAAGDAPGGSDLDREVRIRMIFSALVDADRSDSAAFGGAPVATARSSWPSLSELWSRFEADQQALIAKSDQTKEVNQVRKDVYQACLDAASGSQGVYRLTVPTGGGKTRSGLAFALQHALEQDLDRVIVAIPYTSIIDQTAKVYREILGAESVLEHHSRIDLKSDEFSPTLRRRFDLATENWDAPLVVTTTVQLFESLFSSRAGRARKVHRIANSVILLDEVQTVPTHLLEPTMEMLRALVQDFGATLVLSTATQPALEGTPYISAFDDVHTAEIVPDHAAHFQSLKRVRYEYRPEPLPWGTLAEEVAELHQALVILNTRKAALELLSRLSDVPNVEHLSTLLCGANRRDVLDRVKDRLENGRPVRLVSTQVVEAGVDLDFPAVFRAMGPLDRIVQAAGRCNREGEKTNPGRVIIFESSDGATPHGAYSTGTSIARAALEQEDPEVLHGSTIFHDYFRKLFHDRDLDERGIQTLRRGRRFRKVNAAYRLIENNTVPVVVDYGDGFDRLRQWQQEPSRDAWRALQDYVVNLYRHELLRNQDWMTEVTEGLYRWDGKYDERTGVHAGLRDPADLIH